MRAPNDEAFRRAPWGHLAVTARLAGLAFAFIFGAVAVGHEGSPPALRFGFGFAILLMLAGAALAQRAKALKEPEVDLEARIQGEDLRRSLSWINNFMRWSALAASLSQKDLYQFRIFIVPDGIEIEGTYLAPPGKYHQRALARVDWRLLADGPDLEDQIVAVHRLLVARARVDKRAA